MFPGKRHLILTRNGAFILIHPSGLNWRTERISCVVINTAPKILPGIDRKLLAVPLAALAVSADQKHLVLDADKSKVQAAFSGTPPSPQDGRWPHCQPTRLVLPARQAPVSLRAVICARE
jgi:hypothetical protein